MSNFDLYKYIADSPSKVPPGPHFAVVHYQQSSEWTPPYDPGELGSTSPVTRTIHYVFTDKSTWERAIEELALERASFVAMKVDAVASVRLRAVVDIGS
jgi:hypothetical protein